MATSRKVMGDVGSEELKLVRKQLNRVTAFCEQLQAAAVTDAATFYANVAALTDQSAFEEIVTDLDRPEAPKPEAL